VTLFYGHGDGSDGDDMIHGNGERDDLIHGDGDRDGGEIVDG